MNKTRATIVAGIVACSLAIGFPGTAMAQSANSFTDKPAGTAFTASEGEISVSKQDGDHFLLWDESPENAKSFVYETDVTLQGDGSRSAALLFGVTNDSAPGDGTWYAANFDKDAADDSKARVFRVGSGGDSWNITDSDWSDVDFSGSVHLEIQVSANGQFIYSISQTGAELGSGHRVSGNLNTNDVTWDGGRIGILTWNSGAVFKNVNYRELATEGSHAPSGTNNLGLGNFNYSTGYWEYADNGIRGISNLDGTGLHDSFLYSDSADFTDGVYKSTVQFNQPRGAATLIFRAAGGVTESCTTGNCSYAANINYDSGKARLFKFENGNALDLQTEFVVSQKQQYNIEVHAIGKHTVIYIDGQLAFNTADYMLRGDDHAADSGVGVTIKGQNDAYLQGKIGLLTFNGDVTYTNLTYAAITEANTPQLTGLDVTALGGGTAAAPSTFDKNQYVYIQYVSADTEAISINAPKKNETTSVTVKNASGSVISADNVSLSVGRNIFTVETVNNGAKLVYRLMVHRYDPEVDYYDETYRNQYHYSVKEGWANDPNGMVKFGDTYHLFYQFYNDTVWGPMHWAHATSTDLIHWEDKPITFYPDEYGAMFSGSAVVDSGNASKLCGDDYNQDCLVAIITADGGGGEGNGQRVMIASSRDGDTWSKQEGIVKDWKEDGLNNPDFRDPKVFRYQDTWFMVIAGGPLRIYSSTNLVDWKAESLYGDLHMECPDLFMLPYTDGESTEYKWVLSRGGRTYKVGDFRQEGGVWQFIPDEQYAENGANGVMNLAKDAYAAQTYYQGEFVKSAANPDVIAIQWMNTWEDYCNKVAPALVASGQHFNGSFDLQLKMGLTKDASGKFLLTSTPLSEYETLRMGTHEKSGQYEIVPAGQNVMQGFSGNQYEMVATFTPQAGASEVGVVTLMKDDFSKGTSITYNFDTNTLAVNRANAHDESITGGMYKPEEPEKKFMDVSSQVSVKPATDGSVTLHIFVDRSSVEVFADDYTMAASVQVLPDESWQGLNMWASGGTVNADVQIYPLQGIWASNQLDEPSIASIAVTKQPTKTEYLTTDTAIDAAGLEVTAMLSNGTKRVLETSEYGYTFDFSTAGSTSVTVTLTANSEVTTRFNVTVAAPEPDPDPDPDPDPNERPSDSPIKSIAVTSLPTDRVFTQGAVFSNFTGLVVTATLEDNNTWVMPSDAYKITGFNSSKLGSKPITVTAIGPKKAITAQFSVLIASASYNPDALGVKTSLNTMVTLAGKAKQAKFTEASWNLMNAKLTAAKDLKTNSMATQAQVDVAYCDLLDAYNSLVIKL
ncbi:GH32 C-terminal domain-containing protein [Bifidobacterium aquikefiri]|uniref:GH32 C-terminal domain-containing protein n=1 Tax=Bifidobacterium aquikefiri TaxID=1653207 RepID=UPI0039ECFEEC